MSDWKSWQKARYEMNQEIKIKVAKNHPESFPFDLGTIERIELALFNASEGSLCAYSDKGTIDMRLRKALLGISLSSSTNSTRENRNNDHRRRLEPLVQIDKGGDRAIRETVHIIPHSTIDEEDSARKLLTLREKQRCLVFYNHSLKCNVGAGNKCPKLGTWCAKQKELSKHLAHCDEVICSFPNCYFSRQVLHHYMSCKDKSKCHLCKSARRQMILLDNQILACSK